MPGHPPFNINAILKPLRHAIYTSIYEVLRHMRLSFYRQIACFKLILVRKLLKILLYYLLAVLNWCKVWRIRTIEEVIELVLTLLDSYKVVVTASSMSRIVVFFEDKRRIILYLFLHYRLEDLVPIHLER
jgi:hypothetical protein